MRRIFLFLCQSDYWLERKFGMRGEKQLSREEVSGHVLNIEHYEKMLRVGIMQSRGSELDQASWSFHEENTIPPCSAGWPPSNAPCLGCLA